MKRVLIVVLFFVALLPLIGQEGNSASQAEIQKIEKEFGAAILKNDPDAIGQFLADDWIIVDASGGIIDRPRFLEVVRSGALSHQSMDSDDVRVQVHGNAATVTALTTTKGKYMGQDFTTRERATDVFVKEQGRWKCVISQLTTVAK